jgi:hypothetical protein
LDGFFVLGCNRAARWWTCFSFQDVARCETSKKWHIRFSSIIGEKKALFNVCKNKMPSKQRRYAVFTPFRKFISIIFKKGIVK